METHHIVWLLRYQWKSWCRHPSGLPSLITYLKLIFGTLVLGGTVLILLSYFIDDFSVPLQYFSRNLPKSPPDSIWFSIQTWFWVSMFISSECFRNVYTALIQSKDLELIISAPISSKSLYINQFGRVALQSWYRQILIILLLGFSFYPSFHFIPGLVISSIALTFLCTNFSIILTLVIAKQYGLRRVNWPGVSAFLVYATSLFTYLGINASDDLDGFLPIWQFFSGNVLLENWLGPESWLWLPAQTVLLNPLAIILVTLFSAGLTMITYHFMSSPLSDVLRQSQLQKKSSINRQSKRFIQGVTLNILLKEWRILLRGDGTKYNFILYFMLFAVMIAMVTIPAPSETTYIVAAIGLGVLSIGMLSTWQVTYLCFSQQQDLTWLKSSPVDEQQLQLSKMLSILLVMWGLFIPILGMMVLSKDINLLILLLFIPMTVSQALLTKWHGDRLALKSLEPSSSIWEAQDTAFSYLQSLLLLVWLGLAICLYLQYWVFALSAAGVVVGIFAIALSFRKQDIVR